jgi:hypothetical protein
MASEMGVLLQHAFKAFLACHNAVSYIVGSFVEFFFRFGVSTVLHVFGKGQIGELREWRVHSPATWSARERALHYITYERQPDNNINGKRHDRTTWL